MPNKQLYELFHEYGLAQHLEKAFFSLGMQSRTVLADDQKVIKAAKFAYEALPFLLRSAVHSTIGEKGFIKLVFQIRNGMLNNNGLDLSWLDQEKIKAAMPQQQSLPSPSPAQQAHVPAGPAQAFRFSGNDVQGGAFSFVFPGPLVAQNILGVIGRDPNQCQFVISTPSVSRVHAQLKHFSGSGVALRDLGSSYGTFLNKQKLDRSFKTLSTKARIDVGGVTINAMEIT